MPNLNHRKPRRKYVTHVFFPVLTLALAVSQAYGNSIKVDNIWYRDYLDFAQNKGQFKPGATNLEITKKDGTTFKFPDLPMPDFSAVSKKGNTTSIGGAYVVTATHNRPEHHAIKEQSWGNTTYKYVNRTQNGDFSAQRLNKFVVETEGITDGVTVEQNQAGWDAMHERYGVDVNGKRKVIAFRVGSGQAQIKDNGKVTNLGVVYEPTTLSASMFEIEKWGAGWSHTTDFTNIVTGGDSGSSWLVYDNQEKKWVILGTLTGTDSTSRGIYTGWHQATVDKIKEQYTNKVALDGKQGTFAGDSFTVDSTATKFKDKDLSLTGGGTLTLTENLDMGVGGLIFDKNKTYAVNGENFTYKGAGIDIGEGSTVDWNVKGAAGDHLHKIGKGTLKVNVTQGNNLKVGNGTVELNATDAFSAIYVTSGNATVKLNKADALGNDDFGGIYFANRGGTLDLNGHNFEVKKIAANDVGANVTNNSDQKATVKIQTTDKYIYHGTLTNNIDLDLKRDQKNENSVIVLDGGTSIKGNIDVANNKLVMQGHAVTHAVVKNTTCTLPQAMCAKPEFQVNKVEGPDAQKYDKNYMVSNTVSSFDQPDWETREYVFDTLKLKDSEFLVGRNSIVKGNIDAVNSTIEFGTTNQIYRDDVDGQNITGSGFGFQQSVVAGTSVAPTTVKYVGDIKATNSSFVANNFITEASFDLDNSKYRSEYAFNTTKIRDKGVHLKNKSDLYLNAAYVEDAKQEVVIEADNTSKISMGSLSVMNSHVDVRSSIDVRGRIEAEKNSTVKLKDWTYKDTNLWSDATSEFQIDSLTAKSGSNIQAGLTINDELTVASMERRNAAFGVRADRLTLNEKAVIKADFSSEALSVNNLAFDKQYTLVSANQLTDKREDKHVQYAKGNGYHFEDRTGNNSLDFIIHRDPAPKGYTSFYKVPDDAPMPDAQARANAVLTAYAERYGTDDAKKLAENVVAHNQNSGDNKYQEVALYDALNNQDINAGVEALHNIKTRTDDTYQALGRQIDTQKLFAPVRSAVMNRLASLSMGQGQRDEGASRFFMDAGAGFFNGDDDLRYVHTGFGTDAQVATGDNSLIVGGMLGIGRASDKFGASNEIKADMYTMTGYLGWQNANGWELQNFLTGAYLNGDRTIHTEINLGGAQTFDEKGWALMNATYLKYRIPLSEGQFNVSLKPMLLADLTWSHVGDTNTEFFKRDGASEFTGYAGAGLELEASSDKQSYYFQLTGRQRLTGDTNTVGVNLNGSNGFTNIDVNAGASFIADMNVMAKLKLTPTSDIDLSVGASADSEGGKGAHGQARVNWYF